MKLSSFIVAALAAWLACWPVNGHAQAQEKETPQKQRTYLLSCAASDAPAEIKVIERTEVKKALHVDLVGLRLWGE